MKRIKISDHFYLDEYVSPEFYHKWGEKCIWWIRPEVIAIDEFIRKRFNKAMILNNWFIGGNRMMCGLRYPMANIGAGDSLHKFGCASDKAFKNVDLAFYAEIRQDIVHHWKELYKPLGLTTVEANTEGWLHTDIRNIPEQEHINIVYP